MVRQPSAHMVGVILRFLDQRRDMVIVKRVINRRAATARRDLPAAGVEDAGDD